MIRNVQYVEPFKILKFDIISGPHNDLCSYEIAPAYVRDNQWVPASPTEYHQTEIGQLILTSYQTVWTDEVVSTYKAAHEAEIVASYNDRTLTEEQFAQILAAVPDVLPSGPLFRPNQLFLDTMLEVCQGRHVIECGAGNGHTGKALADAGLGVTCLDLTTYAKYEFPVSLVDATTFPFDSSMVCLICRPDREDWFRETIERALQNGCVVVYVRKKPLSEPGAQLLAERVGDDEETMYKIEPQSRPEMDV